MIEITSSCPAHNHRHSRSLKCNACGPALQGAEHVLGRGSNAPSLASLDRSGNALAPVAKPQPTRTPGKALRLTLVLLGSDLRCPVDVGNAAAGWYVEAHQLHAPAAIRHGEAEGLCLAWPGERDLPRIDVIVFASIRV
jgi:hypothetical protein